MPAYIGISGRIFAISAPISFCPFCGKSLAPKRKLIEPEYKHIDESDIKVGDYICTIYVLMENLHSVLSEDS